MLAADEGSKEGRKPGGMVARAQFEELERRLLGLMEQYVQLTMSLQAEQHKNTILNHELQALPDYIVRFQQERGRVYEKCRDFELRIGELERENRELRRLAGKIGRVVDADAHYPLKETLPTAHTHRSSAQIPPHPEAQDGQHPLHKGCPGCEGEILQV